MKSTYFDLLPRHAFALCLFILCMVATSCTQTTRTLQGLKDNPNAIADLRQQLLDTPDDLQAMTWLGYVYLTKDSLEQANALLSDVHERDPAFPGIAYIYGLYNEEVEQYDHASAIYTEYLNTNPRSGYKNLVQARQEQLRRRSVRIELLSRIASEDTLSTSPQTIAVFPLQFQGDNEQFAALGRGLSAMITNDLGYVQDLEVLERLRLDVLTQELELAREGLVMDDSAPRLGLLLGAGRVIGGTYDVQDGNELRVDMALQETEAIQLTNLLTQSVGMDAFFEMQKNIVFQLLNEMEIDITEEERDQIETIPTRNLQAFLAYSRGLQEEDAGQFGQAAVFFEQAVSLDPGFQPAMDRADLNDGLSAGGGDPIEALGAAESLSDELVAEGNSLVESRHLNQGTSLGSLIVPGQDAREPANEASTAFSGGTGPPLPPPSGNNN